MKEIIIEEVVEPQVKENVASEQTTVPSLLTSTATSQMQGLGGS